VWDCEPGKEHVVYEAFTADGECLPPVIFLKQKKKPSKDPTGLIHDEDGNPAYVV
jgi:hypothetical protein